MSYVIFKKNNYLKKIFRKFCRIHNVISLADEVSEFFGKKDKILNVGCGTCLLDKILVEKGFDLVSIDIYDGNLTEEVTPIIYDGKKYLSKIKALII